MADKSREEMTDRELLIRIDERTMALDRRMDGNSARIRWLEVKFWIAMGAVTVLGYLVAAMDLRISVSKPAAARTR